MNGARSRRRLISASQCATCAASPAARASRRLSRASWSAFARSSRNPACAACPRASASMASASSSVLPSPPSLRRPRTRNAACTRALCAVDATRLSAPFLTFFCRTSPRAVRSAARSASSASNGSRCRNTFSWWLSASAFAKSFAAAAACWARVVETMASRRSLISAASPKRSSFAASYMRASSSVFPKRPSSRTPRIL
eukprot:Amastigsp_a179062_5.p2 type:complete len:199 gc:universal Amastigsp_a179062_5:996-1592(+)